MPPLPEWAKPISKPAGVPEWAAPIENLPPQEPQQENGIARQLKLGARASLEGAAGLPLMVGDAANSLVNMVIDGVNEVSGSNIPRLDPASEAYSHILDKIGLPNPETDTEKLVSSVNRGVTGAMVLPGVAAVAKPATQAGQAITNTLKAAPEMQVASGGMSAGASEKVKQEGGGAVAQLGAGVVAGGVPFAIRTGGSTGVRGAIRGGETGRQNMKQNITAFEDAGAFPSVGQATEGRIARGVESAVSKTPGGAGRMAKFAEGNAGKIAGKADDITSGLSAAASGEKAGRLIKRGIVGDGGFRDKFYATYEKLDDAVLEHISPDKSYRVDNATNMITHLTRPIAKAKASSELLAKELTGQKEIAAFIADVTENNGVLPYDAIKRFRTIIGDKAFSKDIIGNPLEGKMKQIYGALTEDMKAAARQAGPKAEKALNRANKYYAAGKDRIKWLQKVINKDSPEKIYNAATAGTKEGATTFRTVVKSVPKEARKEVSAVIAKRMGLATGGKQDDAGEIFSTETFLTNWNKLSQEAKDVLFHNVGKGYTKNMSSIAKVSSNIREGSKVFANPSGTQQAMSNQVAYGLSGAGMITGQTTLPAVIIGGMAAANLTARAMTNPNFVRWLATATKMPIEALPSYINNLSQMKIKYDAETRKEISGYLEVLKQALEESAQKIKRRDNNPNRHTKNK
jgi:hypothetical protein